MRDEVNGLNQTGLLLPAYGGLGRVAEGARPRLGRGKIHNICMSGAGGQVIF